MKKIESVSTIERALADLTAKRETIVERAEVIADQRKVLGFISLVGNDKEATAKLAELNTEASAVAGALDGLDGAIAEGQKRLATARAAEADRADQAEARELAEQLEIFTACGEEIDRALEILVTAPRNMQRALRKMHDLGAPRPDHRIAEELKEYYRACTTGELPPQLLTLSKKLDEELLKKQEHSAVA